MKILIININIMVCARLWWSTFDFL